LVIFIKTKLNQNKLKSSKGIKPKIEQKVGKKLKFLKKVSIIELNRKK
jgi:hypothetical protein